jgi:hypothetical protein
MLYICLLQEEMRWKRNHQRIKISFEDHHTYLTFTAGELFFKYYRTVFLQYYHTIFYSIKILL